MRTGQELGRLIKGSWWELGLRGGGTRMPPVKGMLGEEQGGSVHPWPSQACD